MKKQTAIVIILALAILGLFIWFNESDPLGKQIDQANDQKNANLDKMKELTLKGLVLGLSSDAIDFYSNNGKGLVENDSATVQKMNTRVQQIKTQKNVDTEYTIHSTDDNFVVRAREKGSSNLYCLDTTTESIEPKLVESGDFTATTDCLGATLK